MKQIILMVFCVFLSVLFNLNLHHHEEYAEKLVVTTEKLVEGESAIRGRILDKVGNILVDNVGVKNIVYHKSKSSNSEQELKIASQLVSYVHDYPVTELMKKKYYLLMHENGKALITDEEYRLLEERKITQEEIDAKKLERISLQDLDYGEDELKLIYLYSLMNEGYYYQDKYLLREVSDEVAMEILEKKLEQISIKITPKRVYPFQDSLKGILGSVGNIPKEAASLYAQNGYTMEDIVGISGLEKTYEHILKGTKAKYLVMDDYSLKKVEDEIPGQDLVLNIDMRLQLFLEASLKNELVAAHKRAESIYFHDAYSILGTPTGELLALSGIRLNDDGSFTDITSTMLSSSFAMGSVVKGASNTVGYLTGAITVGKKILDSCVKLNFQPAKCSYKRLGYVDDITALKTSSNYFQFITAIQSTGKTYTYDMELPVTKENFDTYRTTFAKYGLGSLTEIDLPKEQIGMIGEKISGDLLLNLAIGQYDTYTPLELFQYINTIASRGNRYALRLSGNEQPLLNQVGLDMGYYDRILEGFYQVFHGGTASSYADSSLEVSGKTGTSETFYDSDMDGVVDTKTINSTVAFFFPRSAPKYSMIVVAPNITNSETYTYPFTKNISLQMTNYLKEQGFLT